MSEKIVSRSFEYGAEHESSWPPRFPEKARGGISHFDREKGEMVDGYPPSKINRHGTAPMIVFDSMPETYHEGACRPISSRREWELADKETGKITFSTLEESRRYIKKGVAVEEKALKADRRRAALKATQAYRENPKEIKQKLAKKAHEQRKVAERAKLTNDLKELGVKI